jgi:hypothetical protein
VRGRDGTSVLIRNEGSVLRTGEGDLGVLLHPMRLETSKERRVVCTRSNLRLSAGRDRENGFWAWRYQMNNERGGRFQSFKTARL